MLTINLHPFPVLETERLILREMTQEDIPALFQIRSDAENMRYINRPLAQTLQDAEEHFYKVAALYQANEAINWGLMLRNKTRIIGTAGIFNIQKEHHRAETGYILLPEFHQKGIMHEVLGAVINYAFNTLQLHSLEANVHPENIASIRLLEKNNFVREAYFREDFYWQGKFLDSAVYSLLTPKR